MNKKNKSAVDIDTILNSIPTPSIKGTLPFQIVRGVWNAPRAVKGLFEEYSHYKREQQELRQREEEEEERLRQLEEEIAKEREARKEGMRKRKQVFAVKEKTAEELKGYSTLKAANSGESVKAVTSKEPTLSGGLWTDDDLTELIRLVKKYPNGTLSRWEIIATQMSRSVQEVTFMAARLKDSGYRLPTDPTASVAEAIVKETAKKAKKVAEPTVEQKNTSSDALWSQEQQKLLETAIVKYPKSASGDRWQKIANTVPGKSREECLARYKFLVEKVKALKAAKETDRPAENGQEEQDDSEEKENLAKENETEASEVPSTKKGGGKPRNKRKERKKRMEFSSDEDNGSDNDFQ